MLSGQTPFLQACPHAESCDVLAVQRGFPKGLAPATGHNEGKSGKRLGTVSWGTVHTRV